MRVVVLGATGNVGTSLLEALAGEPQVDEVVAVARRRPQAEFAKTTFAAADVARDELEPIVRGADAVVHLAWLIQPGRDERVTRAVNVTGSERVFAAVAAAGVPSLVYASSVGAYSPGPKDRMVDESWPTGGIPTSFYSRHKAEVERSLDRLEREHPALRVVRLRPGLIFKRQAATEIRRLFMGPFVPGFLLAPSRVPAVPDHPRLRFQAVHSLDVGDAYRRALLSDASGPFNVAAEPVLDPERLAGALGARRLPVSGGLLRAGAALAYRLRLSPTEPGWLDMGLQVPLMDCGRAAEVLGWRPQRDSVSTLLELLDGLRRADELSTPPLARSTTGPLRWRELWTGLGRRV